MSTETQTTTKWAIDPAHTEVQFKVKHLVISTVTGTFKKFDGEVESTSDDFDGADVSFTVDTASIDTNNEDRDKHLRSEDFFECEKYPQMTFTEGKLKKVTEHDYKLTGKLTIRGITKDVEVDVEYGGTVQDPWGNTKAGFELTGILNRKDFGLEWNAVTEAGGFMLGDDVKLSINAQLAEA